MISARVRATHLLLACCSQRAAGAPAAGQAAAPHLTCPGHLRDYPAARAPTHPLPSHPRSFRPANRDKRVAGLYFVGASTRPGNGVPLCFISAKLTAQRVLKDLGRAEAAAAQAGR